MKILFWVSGVDTDYLSRKSLLLLLNVFLNFQTGTTTIVLIRHQRNNGKESHRPWGNRHLNPGKGNPFQILGCFSQKRGTVCVCWGRRANLEWVGATDYNVPGGKDREVNLFHTHKLVQHHVWQGRSRLVQVYSRVWEMQIMINHRSPSAPGFSDGVLRGLH